MVNQVKSGKEWLFSRRFDSKGGLRQQGRKSALIGFRAFIMAKHKVAYTIVEVIIVMLFIGILAAIAVPRINLSAISGQKSYTVARKIVTDLRRVRAMAVSDAAGNAQGFALSMTGTSPYSGYEIVNRDTAAVVDSHTIDSAISCTGGNDFEFGPLGNLDGADTQLTVASDGRSFTITITPATGVVKCVED